MKHIGLSSVLNGSLARVFKVAGGDVVGVSLYGRMGDRIAAPSHCVTDPSAPFVRDNLTERFIPAEESIAAKLLSGQSYSLDDGVVSMPSIPFAGQHVCHHFFSEDGQAAVQVVKNSGVGDHISPSIARRLLSATNSAFDHLDVLRGSFEDNLPKAFNIKSGPEHKAVVVYADITGYSKICETYGIEKASALIERLKHRFISPACRGDNYGADIFRPSSGDDVWIAFPVESEADLSLALENRVLPFIHEMLTYYDQIIGQDPYYAAHPLKVSLAYGEIEEALSGPFLRRHIATVGDVLRRAAKLNDLADRTHNDVVVDDALVADVISAKAAVYSNSGVNHLRLQS